jgi:hypothetical protein
MKKNNFTLVTGLWDLGRDKLSDFGRSFDHYLGCFDKLLSLPYNIVVWVPESLNSYISVRRSSMNTRIFNKELEDFEKWFEYYDTVQKIRQDPEWYNQADWLSKSPQAKLKYYNPIVMSKFFMVNDTTIHNPFGSDYFFWIDGGLTNTVPIETIANVEKLPWYMKEIDDKFLFLSFPYETQSEVHGFKADKFNEYCGEKSQYVCRGGFFGGHKSKINSLNGEYISCMKSSLNEGFMGTEENYHTILAYKNPDIIHRFELESNGLVYKFFEHLGTIDNTERNNTTIIPYKKTKNIEDIKTSLYVLTYNSPDQFKALVESYLYSDPDFISMTRKILVDNSTDYSHYQRYNDLCKKYDFEHIKKEENIGICGGRQFVAEHFNESDSEYYIFLEDDMTLHTPITAICGQGYETYTDQLYRKSLAIIHKERYDFLKLTFSEFYGSNDVQWAWYNIPQTIRDEFFPDHPNLPEEGFGDDVPKIIPTKKKRYKGLSYFEGEYYYCNWPLWVSRAGNRKIFLDIKWNRPYEQTWMSNVFQLQKKGLVRSAVLGLSPINHVRFDYYPAEDRIES